MRDAKIRELVRELAAQSSTRLELIEALLEEVLAREPDQIGPMAHDAQAAANRLYQRAFGSGAVALGPSASCENNAIAIGGSIPIKSNAIVVAPG